MPSEKETVNPNQEGSQPLQREQDTDNNSSNQTNNQSSQTESIIPEDPFRGGNLFDDYGQKTGIKDYEKKGK